jgi:phosphatidylinositol alpha 1,6-mannosyltransferase
VRIGHVTDGYAPRMGGIERQVEGLARAQVQRGHEVDVITCVAARDDDLDAGLRATRPAASVGLPRVLRPDSGGGSAGAGDGGRIRYRSAPAARRAVLLGGYDVVHLHMSTFSPLAYLAAHSAVAAGLPTVATVHSMWSYATPIFRAADLSLGWRSWPIGWSAVSRTAAASLRRILPRGTEISVVPNGIEADVWQAGTPAARHDGPIVIASVMRLAARKRPMQLLRMLQAVRDQVPEAIALRAVIVGDGPRRSAMSTFIDRHGLSGWVEVVGELPPEGVRAVLADADLYVAPALLESFGIAALEARAAGLPVVAFARSGVADFITDGVSGALVADDRGMVDALVTLTCDESRRTRIATFNRQQPAPMSWATTLAACETLYARVQTTSAPFPAPVR